LLFITEIILSILKNTAVMNKSLRSGLSFGITSGTITTLGLMVGLQAGTSSRLAVIGGILTIAIADAFSDAFGVHVSEESRNSPKKSVWQSTLSTFLAKFVFAIVFVVAPILLPLGAAVIVNLLLGLSIIIFLSFLIALNNNERPAKVVFEHVAIAVIVILLSKYAGFVIARLFGSA
jgi:VIT1/CCC1 family predicted Fe2+/Mn2+ transporter